MKIFHVTNAVQWSGGMEQISLLIAELQKKGQENVLVCPPGSELIQRFSGSGIKIELLPIFQDYDLIAVWKLKRFIRFHLPDVVHAHHSMAHAIALLSVIGRKRPALVISRRVSFPPRKNPFSKWKYKSKRINKYVVVSQGVKETLIRGGVESSRIDVIYSAVNPEQFRIRSPNPQLRRELNIPEHSFVVGKIANFSRWKGQHIFLSAAKKCLSKNPKIIFLLAGKGTESLDSVTKELGIHKSVRLLGFRKDIPEILSLLSASVNSAIEGEGLSGALRESLAMGIPVIASDVSGNREVVRNGQAGLLVRANDSDQLAEKILYAVENESLLKQMAAKGREWVIQNASLDKMVASHLNLYNSLRSNQ